MDQKQKAEFISTAKKLVLANSAADIDTCVGGGMDFDALTSLSSQISVRYHKAQARKPMNSELEEALKQRIARARAMDNPAASSSSSSSSSASTSDNSNTRNTESCSDIARRFQVSGYKVARTIVEMLCGGKKSFSEIMDDSFQDSVESTLYAELLVCMGNDPYNSQPCNQMQESIGNEFEEYLEQRLREMRLCFETEAELRLRGKPRTPDILFSIPVALPPSEATNHRVAIVNWIDSKAMFADEDTLNEHVEQLQGYINRYGQGMVVYWRGFFESIRDSPAYRSTNGMVVFVDDLPEEWITPVGPDV